MALLQRVTYPFPPLTLSLKASLNEASVQLQEARINSVTFRRPSIYSTVHSGHLFQGLPTWQVPGHFFLLRQRWELLQVPLGCSVSSPAAAVVCWRPGRSAHTDNLQPYLLEQHLPHLLHPDQGWGELNSR